MDSNTSETFTTPYIVKPEKGDGIKEDGLAWGWLILVIIIVVIVILIIIFLMIQKKKKAEEEMISPEQPEIASLDTEAAPGPGPPETQVPSQKDLYYAPPEESSTVEPMPDYSTPVQPQPEYEPFEQPEQEQLEDELKGLEE